jgi:hypothetical protein
MPLPRINHFLSRHCHCNGRNDLALERVLHAAVEAAMAQGESDMKIYLLIMLIGALLTAVHFTSAPKRQSETLPQ